MGLDFCNENGLVDGRIPAGQECPFWKECECKTENCPVGENVRKENAFSCAAARGFSIIKSRDNFKDSEKVLMGM